MGFALKLPSLLWSSQPETWPGYVSTNNKLAKKNHANWYRLCSLWPDLVVGKTHAYLDDGWLQVCSQSCFFIKVIINCKTLHLLEVKPMMFLFAKVNGKSAFVTILAGAQLDSALKLKPMPQIDNCRKMEQGKTKRKYLPCSSTVPHSDIHPSSQGCMVRPSRLRCRAALRRGLN